MSDDEGRVWITAEADEARAVALASELELPLPISRILVARGLSDSGEAERFLNPRLSDLADPFDIIEMLVAVEHIWQAIQAGSRITIFGDYDADGVSSTALMVLVLQRLGATPEYYIPSRQDDGYGLTVDALTKAVEKTSPDLIITVDCGTNSNAAVTHARKLGIGVIVTDHHECLESPPSDAIAVVNPKLGECDAAKVLAGVGVAFKLCHGLVKHGNANGYAAVDGLDLRDYLDLVALGTVADVVPLMGENRILVRHGLLQIKASPRCGLSALIRVAGVRTEIDCYHLGFLLGPRINAAGRLGSAEPALKLLLSEDPSIAKRLAGQLDAANRERRRIEETIVQEAVAFLDTTFVEDTTFGLVVGSEGWHIGTVGIVAARLCSRYKRPAVVVAFDGDGLGRGSCRSVGSINLVEVLHACADLLESHGGHAMAAGVSIRRENMEAFRERFNTVCREQIKHDDLVERHVVDGWITFGEADKALLDAIGQLRPLGMGNPTPIWGTRNVRIMGRPRVVGKNHLKMTLVSGGSQLDAIAFGMAGRKLFKAPIDILFNVQVNNYLGRESVQLSIKDFRVSHQNEGGV